MGKKFFFSLYFSIIGPRANVYQVFINISDSGKNWEIKSCEDRSTFFGGESRQEVAKV